MKVEVSAIIEGGDGWCTVAITPAADHLYIWKKGAWQNGFCHGALERWNALTESGRRIHRGIFTIEVKE